MNQDRGKHVRTNNRTSSPTPRYDDYAAPANYTNAVQSPFPEDIRKKTSVGKRIGIAILAVFLVIVIGAIAYSFWFNSQVNNRISMDNNAAVGSLNGILQKANGSDPYYLLVTGLTPANSSGENGASIKQQFTEQADFIILARIDTTKECTTLVFVPRNTPHINDDGSITRLRDIYTEDGPAALIEAVSSLTDVPISHYAEVHLTELKQTIDNLGGIKVKVNADITADDPDSGEEIVIKKGVQVLTGKQAYAYMNALNAYESSKERHCINNFISVLNGTFKQALNGPLWQIPNNALIVADSTNASLELSDIVKLGFDYKTKLATTYKAMGPSAGAKRDDLNGLWVCYENPEGWSKLMDVVDSGNDPSEAKIDYKATQIIPKAA